MSGAGGAMAGIIIGRNLALLEAGLAQLPAAWAPLAARGLAMTTAAGRPAASGAVLGFPTTVAVVTDLVQFATTEVRVEGGAGTMEVGVYPSPGGMLGRIRSWLGQDIEVGDPGFDARYLVTALPAESAAKVLGEPVRAGITALSSGTFLGLTLERGVVTIRFAGVVTDADTVSLALDVAVDVLDASAPPPARR